ncbi:hypothetical protein ABPG74_011851 [Tetrahymena malaccensis]
MQGLLSKFAKFSNKQLTNSIRRFAGNHHHHAGDQPDRVADKIIWINIQNRIGQFERISAFEGESLLEALQRNKVAGIVATCEGGEDINTMLEKPIDPVTYGPFCSSCQVVVSNPWRNKMGDLHYLEERNLVRSSYPTTENSRLACCVLVEKWMNEMIISIPQNPNSVYEDNM